MTENRTQEKRVTYPKHGAAGTVPSLLRQSRNEKGGVRQTRLGTGTGTAGTGTGDKSQQEPFARERVIAASFAKECPLPPGKTEELARLLSSYREELREAWQAEARARARRAR
jgi:hypothetical protein